MSETLTCLNCGQAKSYPDQFFWGNDRTCKTCAGRATQIAELRHEMEEIQKWQTQLEVRLRSIRNRISDLEVEEARGSKYAQRGVQVVHETIWTSGPNIPGSM